MMMKMEQKQKQKEKQWRCWYEAVTLVMERLDDARSLAAAAQVCKTWRDAAAQHHLWRTLCLRHCPSFFRLQLQQQQQQPTSSSSSSSSLSFRKILALRHTASAARVRPPPKTKPWLSLHDLIFLIDVHNPAASLVRRGQDLEPLHPDVFHLSTDMASSSSFFFSEDEEQPELMQMRNNDNTNLNVSVGVLLQGTHRLAQLMDLCKPDLGFSNGNGNESSVFSQALPHNNSICCCCCCSAADVDSAVGSASSAHLVQVYVRGSRLSLCFLNTRSWRYFSLDDALLYIQHAFV